MIRRSCLWGVLTLLSVSSSCRALPPSMAMMVVGDAVNDRDIKSLEPQLIGQAPSAADDLLGERAEAFFDPRSDYEMMIYPVKGNLWSREHYVVEVAGGEIVALTKAIENIDGAEDALKVATLKDKLLGKTPYECRRASGFDRPVRVLRRQITWNLLQVYDVRNFTNLRGARYCVVEYDLNNRCQSVKLVGVSASTSVERLKG